MGDVARPKRSLSSTIRCFFGNSGRNEPLLFQPVEEEPQPIAVSEPMEAEESVIVYQGDGVVRPPVLPILPVQRLRLLRQKQELRRRHILEVVHNSPLQLNLSNYSYKSSSTPSPMRAAHVALNRLPLKKKKLSGGIGKGTKWSGDLEYDLAEYDTTEKNANLGHDSILHEDTGSKDATSLDVNADKLSTEQRNVLLKGPRSAAQRALPSVKSPQEKSTAKGEKVVLPSVGFDFIKGSDTPSKVRTPRPDDEDEEPRRKKRIGQASGSKVANQHFDANGGNQTEGESKTQQHKFTFGQNNDHLLVGQKRGKNEKPAFDKENDKQSKQVPRSEQDELQGKQPTFSFQQKDKTAQPKFNIGEKSNKLPKPAFVYGQKKDGQPKPAFTFGEKKDEQPKPAFDFGEKKGEQPQQAFNFGEKKDVQPKPAFNFGVDKEGQSKPALKQKTNDRPNTQSKLEQDSKEPKPVFSFGSGPDENLAITSGTKTGETVKPELAFNFGQNKDVHSKPVFNFKAKSEEPKHDLKQDSKPTFSFGAGQSGPSKPSLSFGSNNNDKSAKSDPSSNTNLSDSKQSSGSNGFSFSRIQQPAAAEQATSPSFTFGIDSNDKPVASGPNVFAPTPKNASKPFSFPNPSSNAPWTAGSTSAVGSTSATTGNNAPSFNFKFGAGANSQQVPAPTSNPSVNNPFVSNRNGFAFSNTNGAVGAGGGVLNAQAPAQTAPQVFGNAPSVSPAFGKSTSPSTMPNSNPSSRAFTPSSTINLNFGNVGSADPSTIFSGGGPQNAPMGTASPQQIFGGGSSQSPAQIFGQPAASQQFGAAPGVGAGMALNPSQPPVTNFQLPPGRKLARMRQSRRG
ncbi:NUP1 (YOR098C) [Zygosaccharomyces parabailii]|nr:NUP1 (YOR098C) [Zygosaccharomyces parabailii]CDH17348.1 uncharacterized protein ZBAI_09136 [Zygosaccharomyces bailii ISA1307]